MERSAQLMRTDSAIPDTWQPLLELATREVFEIMLGTRLNRCPESEPLVAAEFTAMVGLAGQLCGVFSIRCSSAAAILMASKMLGVDPDEVGQQSWDAIGEVCNMIAGNFKAKLSGMGSHCMLSVPTVITGADYQLHSLADGGLIEVEMDFESMPLSIALELHN